jgi:hypothetical protein
MLEARDDTRTVPDAPVTRTLDCAPTESATVLADTASSANASAETSNSTPQPIASSDRHNRFISPPATCDAAESSRHLPPPMHEG